MQQANKSMWYKNRKDYLEISGFEPETKICKINVLPIKPYPHFSIQIYKSEVYDLSIYFIFVFFFI